MSSRLASSEKTRSRPCQSSRTRPTRSKASRWRVSAWRVTPVASLRREIESGPSAERRPSSPSRVVSPRAANTGAASGSLRAAAARLGDIRGELLRLSRPALVVHAVRLGAARERDAVEARLDDRDRCALAVRDLVEPEFDQGRGLGRVVDLRVGGVGVPAVGEVVLRLDALDAQVERQGLAFDGDAAAHRGARGELAVELDAEPGL